MIGITALEQIAANLFISRFCSLHILTVDIIWRRKEWKSLGTVAGNGLEDYYTFYRLTSYYELHFVASVSTVIVTTLTISRNGDRCMSSFLLSLLHCAASKEIRILQRLR